MGIMLNVHSIEPIVVEEFFSSPINFLVKNFHNNSSITRLIIFCKL